jgi:type I restriction enzyme S subunit
MNDVNNAPKLLRAKSNGVISAETLKVLLRTKMYRDWLLKFNAGTSYPVIRDDVLGLPIPIVDSDTQRQIADLVQHSFALKAQSAHLLEVAKRAVEVAIEQDEAAALAYIAREGQHGD